jgi:cell division transport system permease protein
MGANLMFLVREAWLNVRRQGLMVLACVTTTAVSLTILAVFVLLAWHVHSLAVAMPRRFEVHAFCRVEVPRAQVEELVRTIEAMPGVARVRLVAKEEAWPEYRKSWPSQEDLAGLTENPLPDKLEIMGVTPERSLEIAEAVRALPEVERVREGKEVVRSLLAIAGAVRVTGITLALLLALGAAAIVGNAIRLTLLARRRDIRVMQLVGATDSFIRLPFLLEGLMEGALGGLLACAVTAGALHYFTTRVLPGLSFVNELRFAVNVPLFCAALVVGGALLGALGSLFSMRRFLRAT